MKRSTGCNEQGERSRGEYVFCCLFDLGIYCICCSSNKGEPFCVLQEENLTTRKSYLIIPAGLSGSLIDHLPANIQQTTSTPSSILSYCATSTHLLQFLPAEVPIYSPCNISWRNTFTLEVAHHQFDTPSNIFARGGGADPVSESSTFQLPGL